MRQRFLPRWTTAGVVDAVVVVAVIYVTLWSLHPGLLLSSSTITGGDTGAHVVLPAYLRSQGDLFNWTPWYPGWFAGMPAYSYYFVLPDVLATWASYLINYSVAFKLVTVLGSVLMPVAAYCLGRLFRAPRPIPAALAVATLPFLFDASFTIDGGNLFSTMAGEYAFSFSLALSLVTIGLFARGVRTSRGYWWAAVALSATLLSHVLPWFFALVGVVVVGFYEILQRRGVGDPHETLTPGDHARPVRFALGAGFLSLGLSAWWLIPFVTSQSFTNSMGYTNDNVGSARAIFTTLGWFNAAGGGAGDRWVIVLAAVAFVVAFVVRDRLGMVLVTLTGLSLAGFIFDPQGVIWNERLVPFWFITIHLSAGWLFGYGLARWARRAPHPLVDVERDEHQRPEFATTEEAGLLGAESDEVRVTHDSLVREPDADRGALGRSQRLVQATVAVALLGLASTLPGLVPPMASALGLSTSGNQVTSWAQWNYSGYQAKPAWPEYHNLMTTMQRVSRRYGCGRAMWEYNANENRFGTPMALMLLPYWTNNCVGSMEGLYFETSATTPYHFLDQAELSAAPSDPQVGLPYGNLNVTLGVAHLQMLGVKYYIAFSPTVVAQANADPALHYVTSTKPWPAPGVTWRIYTIEHSPLVQSLARLPNVVSGLASRTRWLDANTTWWLNRARWPVLAASAGPRSWPRVSNINDLRTSKRLANARISRVVDGAQRVSFHVGRVGVPVLVKISYYPRWHATGGRGPFRVSPNLMVVIPTAHEVTLAYTTTPALQVGSVASDLTALAGVATLLVVRRRRRKSER